MRNHGHQPSGLYWFFFPVPTLWALSVCVCVYCRGRRYSTHRPLNDVNSRCCCIMYSTLTTVIAFCFKTWHFPSSIRIFALELLLYHTFEWDRALFQFSFSSFWLVLLCAPTAGSFVESVTEVKKKKRDCIGQKWVSLLQSSFESSTRE